MSDTPRTDVVMLAAISPLDRAYKMRLLAEDLERENAKLKEDAARLDRLQNYVRLGAAAVVEVTNAVAEHGDIRRAIDDSATMGFSGRLSR